MSHGIWLFIRHDIYHHKHAELEKGPAVVAMALNELPVNGTRLAICSGTFLCP